jgi:hypothetical protein
MRTTAPAAVTGGGGRGQLRQCSRTECQANSHANSMLTFLQTGCEAYWCEQGEKACGADLRRRANSRIWGCREGANFNRILKNFGVRDEYAKVLGTVLLLNTFSYVTLNRCAVTGRYCATRL